MTVSLWETVSPVTAGQLVDQLHPFADRRAGLADILERAAEIDIGRLEVRLEPDAVAEGVDGADEIAQIDQRHAVVEIDRMQQFMVAVEGDPDLVQLGHQRPLLHRLQRGCAVEQVHDRKLAQRRLLRQAGIQFGGGVDLDGLVGMKASLRR